MTIKKTSKAVGSSFDNWLSDQGEAFRAEVIAGAMKHQFVIALRELMRAQGIGVNAFQKMLGTGLSQVQRLSDPEDVGISLKSIAKLLADLGAVGKLSIEPKKSRKRVA